MIQPRVLILRTAGTNCDRETACAFQRAGAEVLVEHIQHTKQSDSLSQCHILCIPGGFSYGDDFFT